MNSDLYQTSGSSPGQQSPWLTAAQAADYLQVEPRTILQWVRQGKVQGFALSGTKRTTWRFRREDLDASLSSVRISQPSVALTNGRIQ
jgi:excisionase family DNA binding protein